MMSNRKTRKRLAGVLVSFVCFLKFAPSAMAVTIEGLLPSLSTEGPCAAGDIPSIGGILCVLAKIISLLLGLGGAVALIFMIFGGLQYMASGGDEKALTTAKATITYAVLGLIVILGAVFGINQILLVFFE